MLRKTIFALSTAAALSAATLAPTSAFAGGGGGGGWHGGGWHGGGLGFGVGTAIGLGFSPARPTTIPAWRNGCSTHRTGRWCAGSTSATEPSSFARSNGNPGLARGRGVFMHDARTAR